MTEGKPMLTRTQGYAISDEELNISRDRFQRKFGDPQTGEAE
jgi:hypothetical protein